MGCTLANDGFMPKFISKRVKDIPIYAILTMASIASILILVGGLQLILEFGSITFLLVSLLMSIANFKIRKETNSSLAITVISIIGLSLGTLLILYYEFQNSPEQLIFIALLYLLLTLGAWAYTKVRKE